MRRQFGFADLLEPEVIGIFHEDVHVVVPGDEAFMPHRSKSGSKSKEIRDIVLFADPVHLFVPDPVRKAAKRGDQIHPSLLHPSTRLFLFP